MTIARKIGLAVLNMGVQRILDFVSLIVVTTVVVRSLSRDEYGMLSLVLSYGMLFNVLNISVSSVLIRDFIQIRTEINRYMNAFVVFSALKGVAILAASIVIGVVLHLRYENTAMLLVLGLSCLTMMVLFLAEPFAVLLSVDFRQFDLTKIALISSVLNVVLSFGAIWLPTALFVSVKNAAVGVVGAVLTINCAVRSFGLRPALKGARHMPIIRGSFMGFSLWAHLIGVMTDFIYRADLLILGWLNASFRTVGNYNIALQIANFSKLLPQILQYNTTLGLSRSESVETREKLTFFFLKYSFLLSCTILAGYVLFGRIVIRLVAGSGVEEIFALGLYIIAGLCVFNTFRPLISYGIVAHDIRECFLYAILPSGAGTLGCYVALGVRDGALGLAKANLIGGLIMASCTLAYIHLKTGFRWRVALVTETEREIYAKLRARFQI